MTNDFIPMSARFTEALGGAAQLHANHRRKGTTVPYIAHLLGVASIALQYGADEDEAIAALLHDAIEDAPKELGANWVKNWVRFRFGERVLTIVEGCTDTDVTDESIHGDPERKKRDWRPRKIDYVARLPKEPPSVLLVSAADKLHNATAILSDFREIRDRLWQRFNEDAGKAGVLGYYRGLATAYQSTPHYAASARFARLVRELDAVVTQLEVEAGQPGVWPPA